MNGTKTLCICCSFSTLFIILVLFFLFVFLFAHFLSSVHILFFILFRRMSHKSMALPECMDKNSIMPKHFQKRLCIDLALYDLETSIWLFIVFGINQYQSMNAKRLIAQRVWESWRGVQSAATLIPAILVVLCVRSLQMHWIIAFDY